MLLAVALALAAQTSPPPSPAAHATERPAAAAAPVPDARTTPPGLDPWLAGGLQIAGGSAAACVGCGVFFAAGYVLGLIPVFGPALANVVAPALAGALIGGTETTLGDVFGRQRAGMFLPMLASALGIVVGVVATIDLSGAIGVKAAAGDADANTGTALLAAFLGGGAATAVVAVVLPAVVYAAIAVDKEPGDTGQGVPGLFAPAHPKPPAPVVVGMAY